MPSLGIHPDRLAHIKNIPQIRDIKTVVCRVFRIDKEIVIKEGK